MAGESGGGSVVGAVVQGIGSVTSFLDGVIYSPQERAADKLRGQELVLGHRQVDLGFRQLDVQERLALLHASQGKQGKNLMLLGVGGVLVAGVTIAVIVT